MSVGMPPPVLDNSHTAVCMSASSTSNSARSTYCARPAIELSHSIYVAGTSKCCVAQPASATAGCSRCDKLGNPLNRHTVLQSHPHAWGCTVQLLVVCISSQQPNCTVAVCRQHCCAVLRAVQCAHFVRFSVRAAVVAVKLY
eukprot:3807-Heterococcus_DN1.PRE.2